VTIEASLTAMTFAESSSAMHLLIKTYFTSILTQAWSNAATMLNSTKLGTSNHTDHPLLN